VSSRLSRTSHHIDRPDPAVREDHQVDFDSATSSLLTRVWDSRRARPTMPAIASSSRGAPAFAGSTWFVMLKSWHNAGA